MSSIKTVPLPLLFVLLLVACDSSRLSDSATLSGVQLEASGQLPDTAEINVALMAAAANGDVATTRRLLAQGADVNTSDARGITPLIGAAYQNHLEVARELIDAGADVNVRDASQQSAYLISTSEGYLELLQLTLTAGADVHSLDSFNGTGLIRAADRGHVEIIEELLKTDIKIDHVNRLGWTALLEAIILGDGGPRHTEVVRLLVEAGADVHLADSNGQTPLEHARRRGFEQIVKILEEASRSTGNASALDLVSAAPQATVLQTAVAVPSETPHPLLSYTIPGLRQRDFPGGQIQVRAVLEQNEAFSQAHIDYPSDDLTITGLMYTPAGTGPFPVLILLHGYIDREQYVAGADTWQAAEFFVSQGYLVLAPDLRSWGESDSGLSLFHMGFVIDVLNLIGSLETLPKADPARIGLWGHSMGGGIVTKVLTIDDRVQAAVLYAPNSADDADLLARWGAGCLNGQSEAAGDHCNPAEVIPTDTPAELLDAYLTAAGDSVFLQRVSPIYHLDEITAPIQIHIGSADGQALVQTPTEWSAKIADALLAAQKEVTYFVYDGQRHSFTGESWTMLLDRARTFFDENLKQSLE
ncbi:MAG: alpha/beta fold hydrolase [Anaerolineae bacterium]|nr:alpha/beta fold hydrolase [Anaerolineae bacterium]